MSESLKSQLESLRPVKDGKIMSMVADTGIDVAPWSFKQDGSQVANPAANPHYCYEWAFGGGEEPIALCVWHRHLTVEDGAIGYRGNYRDYALNLDRIAIDRSNPSHVKSRARDQAKRARKFDSLLQAAYRKSRPVRVVLLLGPAKENEDLGWEASKVRYRKLDSDPWFVESYGDMDGSFRLVRGPRPIENEHSVSDNTLPTPSDTESVEANPADESGTAVGVMPEQFVDQFLLPDLAEQQWSSGWVYQRSSEVRRQVLERARGICECCGVEGFRMANGAIYLETHHVIPLAEKGPDVEWNIVAICPNDHRRTHFAVERAALREQLIAKLIAGFPEARRALQSLHESAPLVE